MWNHPCCPWSPNKTKHRLRFYCCLKRALGSGFVSPPCVIVVIVVAMLSLWYCYCWWCCSCYCNCYWFVSQSRTSSTSAQTSHITCNGVSVQLQQQHHPHQQHHHPHDHHPHFSSLLATASLLNSNNGDDGDDPAGANDVQSNQRVDLIRSD